MMTRSYAEFATQRALGGKDVPRLLAQGERRLRELRAQAEAIPCIRSDGDGRLDTEVLDIEEIASDGTAGALTRSTALARSGSTAAAAAASSRGIDMTKSALLARNTQTIADYHSLATQAQRTHLTYMRKLLAVRPLASVLPPGRVVLLEAATLPAPASLCADDDAAAAAIAAGGDAAATPLSASYLPAVVLSADAVPVAGSASGGTAPGDVDVSLRVLLLAPPQYTGTSPLPPLLETVAPAAAAVVASASVAAALATDFGGMIVSKKGDDDDDLAMLGGGGGKKGKGGKGGGGGGGGGPTGKVYATKGSSSAASAAAASAAASAAAAAAAAAVAAPAVVAAPAAPDRALSINTFHFVPLSTSGGAGSGTGGAGDCARVFGVMRVPLSQIARVCAAVVGTPTNGAGKVSGAADAAGSLATAMITGKGSFNAFNTTAQQLWALLVTHRADVTHRTASAVPTASGALERVRFPDAEFVRAGFRLPPLNPATDVRPADTRLDVNSEYRLLREMEGALATSSGGGSGSKCDGCPRFNAQWAAQRRIAKLEGQLKAVRQRFSIEALALFPEMQARFHVLRQLHYTRPSTDSVEADAAALSVGTAATDSLDVVALKGRVAAEVNTSDELIFTEMIFEGLLGPLSPAECAALLSVLVFQEKSGREEQTFPPIADDDGSISFLNAGGAAAATAASAPAAAPPVGAVYVAGGSGTGGAKGTAAPKKRRGVGEDADEDDEDTPADAGAAADGAAGAASGGAAADGTPTDDATDGSPGDDAAVGEAPAEMAAEPYTGATVTAIPRILAVACRRLSEIAVALGRIQMNANVGDIIPSEYERQKLNFGLLLPTYAWACGVPFSEICKLTEVGEGIIVRTITRLDETCREVRNAARIIGDPLLYRKMEIASTCIKRDVIFAGSLYLN